MKPLALSFFVASIALGAAAAPQDETIAVLEIRSRAHPISAAEVSDRVREAVRRAAPEARIVDREGDADFVISGKLSRGGLGYRATLDLRDRIGELVQRASATASSRRELLEAVEGAAADLLRVRQESAASGPVSINPAPLPEVPAPVEARSDESALNLEADANVLVAWDRARQIEQNGRQRPEDAAYAWRRLASLAGLNPFREIALTRAQQWDAYGQAKRASEAQMAQDSARLRKVLPLASVSDAAKIELLVRFAGAYGFERVSPLVALLPSSELRARAELALDCEVKEAHACVQLARAADEAKDAKGALEFLDRGCAAGAADACVEAGERWLQPSDARDPAKGLAALQRGCELNSAAACVRLARMHEEGEGIAANAKLAADAREKACSAGDGKSCRRLAGMTDEAGRIADLLRKGCDGGDSVSCALAGREPALVQRQLQEASAAAKSAKKASKPTATPAAAQAPAAQPPPASQPRTEAAPGHGKGSTAAGILVFGALTGTAAVMLALDDSSNHGHTHSGRNNLVYQEPQSNGVRTALTVVMGSAAVLATGAGLAMLFSKPAKPETPSVGVGVSPTGVVVSGNFR